MVTPTCLGHPTDRGRPPLALRNRVKEDFSRLPSFQRQWLLSWVLKHK